MTKKQKQEIDFLQEYKNFTATPHEVEDYIQSTVHGVTDTTDKLSTNRLRNAKTRFNLMLTEWKKDLENGLIGSFELLEDPALQSPYEQRSIKSMVNSMTEPEWNGHGPSSLLAAYNYLSTKYEEKDNSRI